MYSSLHIYLPVFYHFYALLSSHILTILCLNLSRETLASLFSSSNISGRAKVLPLTRHFVFRFLSWLYLCVTSPGFVVGQSGLYQGIAMFLVAYFIICMTVLSVCAISTNGALDAGGAYCILYTLAHWRGVPAERQHDLGETIIWLFFF